MKRLPALAAALITALAPAAPRAAPADPAVAAEVAALNDAAKRAVARGDYAAALTAYRTAAQRMRGDPAAAGERATALYLAGVCLERMNRIADALSTHREALALGPPPALADRVRDHVQALEAIVAEAATTGASPAELALARINETAKDAVARKDYETALSAYRDAAARLGAFPDRRAELALAWFLAGRCLEALDREPEAAETYRRARALGPPELQARVDERLARLAPPKPRPVDPPAPIPIAPADTIPITLDCTPAGLRVTVPGHTEATPCAALTALPPGTWRLEARSDNRAVTRTIDVRPPGPHRYSLVLPPPLAPAPPPAEYRLAWGLTLGALVGLGAGATLHALDADAPADTLGTGLLVAGGLLGAAALYAFANPPPATPPAPAGGVLGAITAPP